MPGNLLGITLPSVGVTLGPDYATQINTAIQTIIDDVEAKITPDEIDINANLTFSSGGTSYGITSLTSAAFTAQGSVLAGSNPLTVYSTGGEFYFQDASGNNVQITSSGSVNVASSGSINTTGSPAYGTSGVEVLWSGSDLEFRLKAGAAADTLADLVLNNLEMGNGANRTTITTTVTSDYTITLPTTAAAANDSVVQIDTAGAVAFVRDLDIDTLDTTGDITAAGDLEAARVFFDGTEDVHFSAVDMVNGGVYTGGPTGAGAGSSIWSASSGTNAGPLLISLSQFLVGTDISRVELYYGATGTPGTWTMEIIRLATSSGTYTVVDSDSWTALNGSIASPVERAWAATASTLQDSVYFLRINVPNTANTREVHSVIMTVSRPDS